MSRKDTESKRKSPLDIILEKILSDTGDNELDAWNYIIQYGNINSDWLTFWREQNV
jgi:hypothetical protein